MQAKTISPSILFKRIESLRNHSGFVRYFRNTLWLMFEQILRMFAGFFVGLWVARYLGPEKFGVFNYVLAFTSIFSVIAKLGLDGVVVRDLVNEPEKKNVYLGTAFWLKVFGAILAFAMVVLATLLINNNYETKLYILIIASGIIFQSYEVVEFYFQSQVLVRIVSVCKLIQLLFSSFIKLFLIYKSADLFWFILISLIDQAILAISFLTAYMRQKQEGFYKYFDLYVAKKLMLNSWPLILSGLVIMIYMRIDQIMIKEMLNDKEVGLYSAAVKISELCYFIPVIIANSIFPAIVSAKKSSEYLYYKRLQQLYNFLVWSSIVIIFPMIYMSDLIMSFFYGEAYKNAGNVLKLHIFASIFVFFGVAKSRWMLTENMQLYSAFNTVSGAVSNIVFNFILIPKYGISGAAISTIIAHIFSAVIIPICSKRDRVSVLMLIDAFFLKNTNRVFSKA